MLSSFRGIYLIQYFFQIFMKELFILINLKRCLKTPDIPAVKAQSMYEKLWRLHSDWRANKGVEPSIFSFLLLLSFLLYLMEKNKFM